MKDFWVGDRVQCAIQGCEYHTGPWFGTVVDAPRDVPQGSVALIWVHWDNAPNTVGLCDRASLKLLREDR